MKASTIILFLLIVQISIGQTRTYKEVFAKLNQSKKSINSLAVDKSYKIDDLTYFFSVLGDKKLNIVGLKIVVKNKKGQVLYNTILKTDGGNYIPTFFKTDNTNDETLLFVETEEGSAGYSLGNWVYSIKGETIKQIGLLDVAIASPSTLNKPTNVAWNTITKTDGKSISFNFKTDNLIYHLDYTKKYSTIKGSSISYIYENGKLKIIKN